VDEATLAHYQRVLLTRLRAGDAPEELRRALLADPGLQDARGYVMQLDDDALRVAVLLVAQWSS
jgi:hypothetical protein